MSAYRNSILDAPHEMRVGRRRFRRDEDRGVATMLTAAAWLLQRLPGRVEQRQRGELVKSLAGASNLVIEVHCAPAVILIRDGERALVKIPANGAG
jgi:hypothetical protein